jgi:C4-dicarboxylate transporter DctM subunit
MSVQAIGILIILLLFVLFLMGFEIGFSMALAGFIGYGLIVNFEAAFNLVGTDVYAVFSSYGFIVISLFILMGQIGTGGGISKALYDSGYRFLGHIPGGLAMGTVAAATAFKAICGSATATAATFATVAVPEMDRYGYEKTLSCGTVATVGTLGAVLPPSVALIIYGMLADVSMGKLFLAGIIPGLMLALSFLITIYGWCKLNPKVGPKGEKSTWKARFASLPSVAWVIAVFILVVGGLTMGFFSPTEAGSIGTFAVLVLVVAKRDISVKRFLQSVMDSVQLGCMVLILLAGATILGHFFAVTKMPFIVADWLTGIHVHRSIVIIIILIVFLIGGSFIEDMAFTILTIPIFVPIIVRLGYDPVWFGIVFNVAGMIGIILPPMAMCVFVVSGVTKVPIGTVYKGIYPFLLCMSICLLILIFFPQISLWLPNMLMK